MLLPHGTTVALADGVVFKIFRNAGNETSPELTALPAPKLDTHNKAAGSRHHSGSGNPDHHQLEEDGHAAAAAAWLNRQVLDNAIHHLVVLAPPRTIGEMRRNYHEKLKSVLIGEVTTELTGHGGPDVLKALRSK